MNTVVDLKNWRPGLGRTGVVLYIECEPDKGCRGRLASILHGLPAFMQSRLNLDGSRFHADLSDLHDLVSDPAVNSYNTIRVLRHKLQQRYPEVFGEAEELSQEFCKEYEHDFSILEAHKAGDSVIPGYHKYASAEPLILEPEDWSHSEWSTLCKVLGVKPEDTARLVVNINSLELWNEPGYVSLPSIQPI